MTPHPFGASTALLDQWQARSAFFLSCPSHALLVPRWEARVGPGPQPLTQRVQTAMAALSGLTDPAGGSAMAVVAGAIPFDLRQPAHLGVARHVIWRGPGDAADLNGHTPQDSRGAAPTAWCGGSAQPVPLASHYCQAVARASAKIRHGDLDKVVLARTLELVSDEPVRLDGLLQRLSHCHPNDYVFAVPLAASRMLLGASPELLVSRHKGVIQANPLAGSVPRSPDPAEDQRRARALLASAKDLHEHRVVIEAVRDSLAPLCTTLSVPDQPTLRQTPTLWHLSTPVTGTSEADALTLAMALHPTPAVCGMPVPAAQALIAQSEPFPRDYYAGMLGWMDARGDGEWIVTLRCAEVAGCCIRLYAGAGIVGDSDPQSELAETATKFKTMLHGLGLEITA